MTAQALLDGFTKLHKLHKSLLEISIQKTEALKQNDMESLQQHLAAERKHVQAVGQLEDYRQKLTAEWAAANGQPIPASVSELLEQVADAQLADQLEQELIGLTEAITELKQQEHMNQQLLEQSMHFVKLSLDMLAPSLQSLNYGDSTTAQTQKRSLFDSKA